MKILIVHNFYQQFGGEDFVALQEKERLQKTDDVIVYSRHNHEIHTFGTVQKANFFLNTIHSRNTSADIEKIVTVFRPDFAYVHNIYPLISPSLYHTLHACGIPILQVMHDFRPFCANGWFYTHQHVCDVCKNGNTLHAIQNKCYKNSYVLSSLYAATVSYCRRSGAFAKIDAYLCLNEFMRSLMIKARIPVEKIFIRPNSIDASTVRPAIGRGDYIAYIGRLSAEKGLWTLVRAFEHMQEIPLKIAGTGPLEPPLRTYIHEKKLRNIELVGFVAGEQKWEFLRNSRLLVMPSECYETFGMVILEAYAAGKPVVAADLGGIPALVEEDKSGLLYSSGDIGDLARQVESLWRSPELVGRMGTYSRTLVEQKFSPEVSYQQLIDIAQQVCERNIKVANMRDDATKDRCLQQ